MVVTCFMNIVFPLALGPVISVTLPFSVGDVNEFVR